MKSTVLKSKEMWIAAFYLSKFGQEVNNKTIPPKKLNTKLWIDAYRGFYGKLENGRSISAFQNTMKNTRDDFDSHLPKTLRKGWYENGKPKKLNKLAQYVFDNYNSKSQEEIWNEISKYSDLNIHEYSVQFEDVISFQDSEKVYEIKSKTEGKRSVIISFRYERNPKLRNLAFQIHGYDCMACGFNFENFYGYLGEKFAEVHHVIPLSESENNEGRITNPKTDLKVVCANCHRMIHRKKGITYSIEELRRKIRKHGDF